MQESDNGGVENRAGQGRVGEGGRGMPCNIMVLNGIDLDLEITVRTMLFIFSF